MKAISLFVSSIVCTLSLAATAAPVITDNTEYVSGSPELSKSFEVTGNPDPALATCRAWLEASAPKLERAGLVVLQKSCDVSTEPSTEPGQPGLTYVVGRVAFIK